MSRIVNFLLIVLAVTHCPGMIQGIAMHMVPRVPTLLEFVVNSNVVPSDDKAHSKRWLAKLLLQVVLRRIYERLSTGNGNLFDLFPL